MADDWSGTPDAPWGLEDDDFPPLDLGLEDDDDTPCSFCGEAACERSCTGALLADDAEEGEA